MAQLDATEQSVDPSEVTDLELAAARFEANRQLDRRPPLEHLDRPNLVLSTRDEVSADAPSRFAGIPSLAGVLLMTLGVGAVLGWQLRPQVGQGSAQGPAVPAVRNSEDATTNLETRPATVRSESSANPTALPVAADPELFVSEIAALDLRELTFVPGEINLTQGGIETAERLIDLLVAYPGQPVELRVRTYSESTPGQNHGLSVHQANVLGSILANAGVQRDRLTVVGIGSSDAQQTASAAAILFDSVIPSVRERLQFQGPLTLNEPFGGTFDADSLEVLDAVGAAVGDSPVVLVGYTWSGSSDHLNHELSHDLLDRAALQLEAAGVPASRIMSVGLGSAPVEISQRSTVVTATAGDDAAIAVALRSIAPDAVSFVPGTGELTPAGMRALNSVPPILQAHPDAVVEVAVHSYQLPTSQANHDLSRVQADAIETYLYDQGLMADRLLMVAHGDPPHFAVPGRDSVVTFTVLR